MKTPPLTYSQFKANIEEIKANPKRSAKVAFPAETGLSPLYIRADTEGKVVFSSSTPLQYYHTTAIGGHVPNYQHYSALYDMDEASPCEFFAHEMANQVLSFTERDTGKQLKGIYSDERIFIPDTKQVMSITEMESRYEFTMPEHDLTVLDKINGYNQSQFWEDLYDINHAVTVDSGLHYVFAKRDPAELTGFYEKFTEVRDQLIKRTYQLAKLDGNGEIEKELTGGKLDATQLAHSLLAEGYDTVQLFNTRRDYAEHTIVSTVLGTQPLDEKLSEVATAISITPHVSLAFPHKVIPLTDSDPTFVLRCKALMLLDDLEKVELRNVEPVPTMTKAQLTMEIKAASRRMEYITEGNFEAALTGFRPSDPRYHFWRLPTQNGDSIIIGDAVRDVLKEAISLTPQRMKSLEAGMDPSI